MLRLVVALVLFLSACNRESPPPPGARPAPQGLPPAASGGTPPPTPPPAGASQAPLPAGHPPVGSADALLEGKIQAAPARAGEVKPGDVIYVIARPAGGGKALAVERLEVKELPAAFELTSGHTMSGAPLAGAVTVTARVDRDGEAMTRQAGDLEGTVAATVPAHGLTITLDTPVQP